MPYIPAKAQIPALSFCVVVDPEGLGKRVVNMIVAALRCGVIRGGLSHYIADLILEDAGINSDRERRRRPIQVNRWECGIIGVRYDLVDDSIRAQIDAVPADPGLGYPPSYITSRYYARRVASHHTPISFTEAARRSINLMTNPAYASKIQPYIDKLLAGEEFSLRVAGGAKSIVDVPFVETPPLYAHRQQQAVAPVAPVAPVSAPSPRHTTTLEELLTTPFTTVRVLDVAGEEVSAPRYYTQTTLTATY